jgi:hypothetical protein
VQLWPVACRALLPRIVIQCTSTCTAGEAEVKRLKRADVQFALIAADSLLARDKLNAALKCAPLWLVWACALLC